MMSFVAMTVLAQAPRSASVAAHIEALKAAQSLNVVYRVQEVGGTAREFSLAFAKPNKARIETPEQIIVADGTTMTVYMRGDNAFFKKEQTQDALLGALTGFELSLFAPFFDGSSFSGSGLREGQPQRGMKTANGTLSGGGRMEIFFDPQTRIARQATVSTSGAGRTRTDVLNTRTLALTAPSDAFAFNPPSGAKESTEEELLGARWLSHGEAMEKAGTSRLVMVDFGAEWCTFCKQMEREVFGTSEFKEVTKGIVLAKVDGDKEPGLTQQYGVTGFPTVKFVFNGKVVHEFVGYGGKAAVLAEIRKARQAAGI